MNETILNSIHEKKFCLLLYTVKNGGMDSATAFDVSALYNDNKISLYKQGVENPVIVLEEDDFFLIKETAEEIKNILLDSDYHISLEVKDLPDDEDTSNMRATGLKWPDSD